MSKQSIIIASLLGLSILGSCSAEEPPKQIPKPKPVLIVTKQPTLQEVIAKFPKREAEPTTRQGKFIKKMKEKIKNVDTRGVPERVIIAQACIESAYGKHVMFNNLFCMRGTGPAGHYKHRDVEYIKGKKVYRTHRFKAYHNWEESIKDLVDWYYNEDWFLELCELFPERKDIETFAHYLNESAYATDPNYGRKLLSVIKNNNL